MARSASVCRVIYEENVIQLLSEFLSNSLSQDVKMQVKFLKSFHSNIILKKI